jgi:hypothetical protein
MIKPKNDLLKLLPLEIYKKLPIKDIDYKSLQYLANNYPKGLIKFLKNDDISNDNILDILEVIAANNRLIFQKTLVGFAEHPIPAIREAALFALSQYNTKIAITKILDAGINDSNESIKEIATGYFDEANL